MFQGVHSTVIGDSHIRKGIVCQDSSGIVVTDQQVFKTRLAKLWL